VRLHKCEKFKCCKAFKTVLELQTHFRSHSDERPHRCDQCGKSSKSRSDVNSHWRAVHSERREYKCAEAECGKSFKAAKNLRDHTRVHSSERHPCDECGKTFKTQRHVISHKRAVHNKCRSTRMVRDLASLADREAIESRLATITTHHLGIVIS